MNPKQAVLLTKNRHCCPSELMPKLLGTEWANFPIIDSKNEGCHCTLSAWPCPRPCLLGPEEAQQSGSERGLAPGSRAKSAKERRALPALPPASSPPLQSWHPTPECRFGSPLLFDSSFLLMHLGGQRMMGHIPGPCHQVARPRESTWLWLQPGPASGE